MVEETGQSAAGSVCTSAVFRVPAEYATVSAALAAAAPVQGTVIVDGGTFHESGTLSVAPGVSLEGRGAETVLESDGTVISCADGAVRIASLSIRQCAQAGSDTCFGIELRGKTLVESCLISARCGAKNACGVLARGSAATPTLRSCTVHDCGNAGVILASGARVTLVESDVRACAGCGVLVLASCVLDAQGGGVTGCAEGALSIAGRAAASLTGCELSANGGASGVASVSAKALGRLAMKECTVRGASGMGVQLADGAEGKLVSCQLLGCGKAGVAAKAAGRLQVTNCEIAEGAAAGIMLLGSSTPAEPGGAPPQQLLKGNLVRANAKAGVQISAGAQPIVDTNRILDGHGAGVYVFSGARPVLIDNVVKGSNGPAIKVEEAAPRVERNTCCGGADVRACPHSCARALCACASLGLMCTAFRVH